MATESGVACSHPAKSNTYACLLVGAALLLLLLPLSRIDEARADLDATVDRVAVLAGRRRRFRRALPQRAFARACVVKWETLRSTLSEHERAKLVDGPLDGFVVGIDMRGKLVPCNEENLVKVFTALPGVFLDLREAARSEQLYRLQQREDDAGN